VEMRGQHFCVRVLCYLLTRKATGGGAAVCTRDAPLVAAALWAELLLGEIMADYVRVQEVVISDALQQ
jgi:hypothetical protein